VASWALAGNGQQAACYDVIDILVQPHRDQRAAERFFRRLLRGQGVEPLRITTDKLRSYSAALRTIFGNVTHCVEQFANNRVEASHQPTRQRERQMRGFNASVPGHNVFARLNLTMPSVAIAVV
jgi:transposase-like protein